MYSIIAHMQYDVKTNTFIYILLVKCTFIVIFSDIKIVKSGRSFFFLSVLLFSAKQSAEPNYCIWFSNDPE